MAEPNELPQMVTDLVGMSKEYLRQETLEPAKKLGRFAGIGIGVGLIMVQRLGGGADALGVALCLIGAVALTAATLSAFDERVGHLFRGPETVDRELVQATLDSYRSQEPAEDGLIRTDEALQERYAEHGEIVGLLTDFAHRAGMRAWIAERDDEEEDGAE